jgi:hypothetical protein
MACFRYADGLYCGAVKFVPKKQTKGKKATCRKQKMIPHGFGSLVIDGVKYTGWFRNGFEEGRGELSWPDGTSFTGTFKGGRPNPTILQNFHQSCLLKKRIKALQATIASKDIELLDCKEDLDIEREKTMDVALALDKCQTNLDHSQAKLKQLYDYARSVQGIDICHLDTILSGKL